MLLRRSRLKIMQHTSSDWKKVHLGFFALRALQFWEMAMFFLGKKLLIFKEKVYFFSGRRKYSRKRMLLTLADTLLTF